MYTGYATHRCLHKRRTKMRACVFYTVRVSCFLGSVHAHLLDTSSHIKYRTDGRYYYSFRRRRRRLLNTNNDFFFLFLLSYINNIRVYATITVCRTRNQCRDQETPDFRNDVDGIVSFVDEPVNTLLSEARGSHSNFARGSLKNTNVQ